MVSGVLVTKSSYCVFMYELMMHDPVFSPCLYRGYGKWDGGDLSS